MPCAKSAHGIVVFGLIPVSSGLPFFIRLRQDPVSEDRQDLRDHPYDTKEYNRHYKTEYIT